MTKQKIIIVGGGITGLAAAHRLQKIAPQSQITLLEQSDRLGGKIFTERLDGFLIEGGADSFLSRKPRGTGLCEELSLGSRLQGRNPDHQKTYVMGQGELHRLPEGMTGLVPTNLDALINNTLISAAGRERLAQEADIPPSQDDSDESIADFMIRRLGHEVYTQLVEPLMSGIYAGDGAQLSLLATFPQMRQLERKHGSLLNGLEQSQSNSINPVSPTYPPFVTLPKGMGELVDAMVDELTEVDIRLGAGVAKVEASGNGYQVTLTDGETCLGDGLILTTPAYVNSRVLQTLDPDLAEAHAAIPYVSTAIITLAYAVEDVETEFFLENSVSRPLDGYGYVIPRSEDSDVLACTWTSSKWVGRAPAGYALLRVYVGRYGRSDVLQLSDDKLVQMAQTELANTLQITATPHLQRIYRWPQAMPQYTLGHLDRLAQIDARLEHHPGLLLAGAAYRGVGIPDCIAAGEAAAQAVIGYHE